MEFVGKVVHKELNQFGVFRGTIQSYNSTTGFFTIVYEDGDFEEVDQVNLTRLFNFTSDVVDSDKNDVATKKLGRKTKKRGRKPRDSGKGLKFELDLNCSTDLVDGGEEMVENDEVRAQIDLNLTVESNEIDEVEVKVEKKERGFDLNLGLDDENVDGGNESLDFGVSGLGLGSRSSSDSVVVSNVDVGSVNCEVKVDEGSSSLVVLSLCKDESSGHRKRRRMSKDLNSSAQTVLRRSARRAKAAALIENETCGRMAVDEVNDLNVSGVTDVSEERHNTLCLEETLVLPPKLELPPCSTNVDLDGVPVMDLFSVYSCLRSFSTLLYLSPFELEEFVEALKSKVSNPLIDFIHVSILRMLRKHLESLANEGFESASTCLRNKNWDLLDVITWPIFMVEYLLIHGSWLKPGFTFDHLNLFDGEYYKQPTAVKLELLRCLCDDVIEVEAIRLELGKRMILVDAGVEIDRTMINDLYKKRRISLDVHDKDVMEDVADGNSDECCLCKMDGNLICCDGCPAAYHSKCVGIISDLLPDGEWHCPECVIGRPKFGTQPHKLIRGAELIGNDAHGRLYFSCFDYLLVSDSCDSDSTCNYYHKDDVTAVFQLLQSSEMFNRPILNAICQHWDIPMVDGKHEGKRKKSSTIPGYFTHLGSDIVKCSDGTQNLKTSSEGSAEVVHEDSSKIGSEICCPTVSTKSPSSSGKRKKNHSFAKRQTSVSIKEEDALQIQAGYGYTNCYGFAQTASSIVEELLRKPSDKVNGGALTTEEEIIAVQLKFILKKSIKFPWITVQNLNGESQKEKCGWCYCCRFPVEGRDCLFTLTKRGPISEGFKAEVDAVWLKRNKKGHVVDVICYILYMEERLRGLLVGPWLSPHHSELWRRSVLKASDVSFLKRPLLMLEANLRSLALSSDWWKHVDSVKTMGSSIHYVAKSRSTPKNGVSKRKGRHPNSVTKSSTASGGLRLLWWRGGKTSRSLFNWKVIPRPLALMAARKGGCVKIPGIQYPEGSENARRSTCLTWRASVESSTCLEQLALQVRELDLFVRWDDIENSHLHSILDKESLKSIRLFKKVIVRRKCIDGTSVKYLLDFGKRRCIPDVVIKHGLKIDEPTVERKKYWLEESYMPLHLLKNFEERRISRKAGKANSSKVRKGRRVIKKPMKSKGFDYLFERAERADSYQCGHCNKNVPISEAVSCELCKGYFHKRHVTKSSDTATTGFTYKCHGCRSGKHVKTKRKGEKRKFGKLRGVKKLKVEVKRRSKVSKSKKPNKKRKVVDNTRQELLQNHKKISGHLFQRNDNVYAGMTLRRSARKATSVTMQPSSCNRGDVRKTYKTRGAASKGTSKDCYRHKKRTCVLHSFWSNGLLLSRKPNDERVIQFKKRKLFVPADISTDIDDPPICALCSEQHFISTSTYVRCETCEGWFHGAAFGLDEENIDCVIGFKCHICLDKTPPVCPFTDVSGTGEASTEVTTGSEIQKAQKLPENVVQKETDSLNDFHSNESSHSPAEEVQKVLGFDGNLDHDRTMILDSETSVDNGLLTSKVEAQAIENHTEASLAHDEKDYEISTGIVEVQAVQSCNLNLDHDKTSILGSETSMENGSPNIEAGAQKTSGLPKVLVTHMGTECVDEFHSDENCSGFMEVKTVQSCDGNVDDDETAILDSDVIMENGPPTIEPGAQTTGNHNGLPEVVVAHGETVHDSDENSRGSIAVQTVVGCDENIDHDNKTPNWDTQMSNTAEATEIES